MNVVLIVGTFPKTAVKNMESKREHSKIKKVLCVGSYHPASNALRRTRAFERLGLSVECLNTRRIGAFRHEVLRRFANRFFRPVIEAAWARALQSRVKAYQPDLVFVEKGTHLTAEALRMARSAGSGQMKLAHYNPDDPFGSFSAGWNTFLVALPEYDMHFVPKAVNAEEYKARGARACHVFDRSFDPTLHRPLDLNREEAERYLCEVGFIGTWAPERERVMAELVDRKVPLAIWGGGWQKGDFWAELEPFWRGPVQAGDDYVKAICGMKIALHFLRHENRDEQDSRTFEIPACGSFMLAERSPDHERLFRENEEAVFFDSTDDLEREIRFYLENDEARKAVAAAGRRRCLNSPYSHDARLREFICVLNNTESLG